MPRPQVPRQENKVNNNIKVEMEKRLLSHQLDVSGGSKRPTRNLYQMNQTLNIQYSKSTFFYTSKEVKIQ